MKNRKGFSLVVALVAVLVVLVLADYFAGIRPLPGPAGDNSIKKFASYAEFESFVKANSQGYPQVGDYSISVLSSEQRGGAQEKAAPQAATYSRTNIQVEGVDEADIVKSDGKYIYTALGQKVVILDAYPAENAKIVSEINISGNVNEIFVSKDRLVVFRQENVRTPLLATRTASWEEVPPAVGAPEEKKMVTGPARGILPQSQYYRYSQKTHIDMYDISDRKFPVLSGNASIDGSYFGSRMMGDQVYVIATQPAYYVKGELIPLPAIRSSSTVAVKMQSDDFPDIYYFDVPDRYYAFTSIVSVNINDGTVSGKMLLTGATQNLYVSTNNIYITYAKYLGNIRESDKFIDRVVLPIVPGTVKGEIKRIREDSNFTRSEKWSEIQKVLEGYSKTLGELEREGLDLVARQKMAELEREFSREREKTVIQKLSISDGKVEYKTNGEVPGTILNQFSMDEHNGYFRIATTTTTEMGGITPMMGVMTSVVEDRTGAVGTVVAAKSQAEPGITAEEQKRLEETEPIMVRPDIVPQPPFGPRNNVYVLNGDLKTVGKLEDLAEGEKIYSVRFMGERAYMVTFRQIDPLFVIDLSQPVEPKVLGFLKIPGVSDYLHPYDEGHIIGVGRDASEEGRILGMKLSLFDVTNVSAPREISKYIIGQMGTDSEALRDHKAFLFSREKSLLVIPVSESGRSILTDDWRYWQGAYVFNLDLATGFVLKGKMSHFNEIEPVWEATVRRSLYMDDVLYTLSNKKVKMNRLADLSEVNEVLLPQPTYETPVYTIEEARPAGTEAR